jgi:hypothetical protein
MGFLTFISILFVVAMVLIFVAKELKIKLPKIIRAPFGTIDDEIEKGKKIYPFKKKQYLMTQTEYKFFGALREAVKDKYFIMPQVALSRIIEVQKGLGRYGSDSWYSNFSRINKKTLDFVIFDKQYFSPLLAIELDDYTHNYHHRKIRDEFVDNALSSANINILHIQPQNAYNIIEIETALNNLLEINNANNYATVNTL